MSNITFSDRKTILTNGLAIERPGIEISPLYRPTVLKSHSDVYYTDYTSAEDSRKKHADYEHDEIMDIDFIWKPGKRLVDCTPSDIKFEWAIASHVFEHVPNPIGWLLEVFEVLKPGAVLSLALPHKKFCFDFFRRDTDTADLVDSWIRGQIIPSPRQLFDFLTCSINWTPDVKLFENADRPYTDEQALDFIINSWTTGTYLDAHCSVFSPESIIPIFQQITRIGILNIELSDVIIGQGEFFIKMTKLGEPRISYPAKPHPAAIGFTQNDTSNHTDLTHSRKALNDAIKTQEQLREKINQLNIDLTHARKAFYDAVEIQNQLKENCIGNKILLPSNRIMQRIRHLIRSVKS